MATQKVKITDVALQVADLVTEAIKSKSTMNMNTNCICLDRQILK